MTARRSRLFFEVQQTAAALKQAADRRLVAAAGVTAAQAALLSAVHKQGGAKQNEIARLMGLRESAFTQMTAKLLDRGLLLRERDPQDRRAWTLGLTAEGLTALRKADAAFTAINATIDDILDPEELAQLAATLADLRAAFASKPSQ